MNYYLGIALAFVALLTWGIGDFLIQRSTRRIGVWETLFWNAFAATVILFPFIFRQLQQLTVVSGAFTLLVGLSIVVLFAALFNFTALKEGKIAIVEPIQGIELPITIALAVGLVGERLTAAQFLLMGIVFIGIVFAVTVSAEHIRYPRRILERGVLFAGLGAVSMALMNFLVGVSSQRISPLLTLWFFSCFCFRYIHMAD